MIERYTKPAIWLHWTIGVLMIAHRGGNMRMAIPFGVFLGPAAIVALYVGPAFVEWYAGMYR